MSAGGVTVSVLMVVRDGERYIAEALTSVLVQSVRPTEILVVDDGSTDRTAEILAGFDVTVLPQPPSGIAAALNLAVARSTGSVVSFLDADDLWEPDALAVRLERLGAEPATDAVAGATVEFVSPELAPGRYRVGAAPVYGAVLGATLFRRECFARVGPFDTAVHLAPAVDWVARARTAGVVQGWVEPVVLRRRLHGSNISLTAAGDDYAGMLDVVRRHYRRRASPPAGTSW